ncbi:DUF4865 family protein [Streptomyces djakartensis]|uniref:DUF4865 domain-containing protein n=1 Tax=Streptomyces djakartensis TaxID=68193 RepID=A0ABQ3AEF0_9ACTN|nr:DUF4865 family protein [Streptomyces djakartensis]GGY43472.1 DUF4865 domain-containing protein [Streptomyces djakartensis]
MHAMQYGPILPADYDMGVIRDRVARRGHLLDDWDGLGLKAYLVRERGLRGSPVNQYAPFYLWNTVEGMNAFLWGGGFQGLSDDFGRPSVRQWTGLAFEEGAAANARFAVRRCQPVPDTGVLAETVQDAVRETRRLAAEDGVLLAAAAVDTRRWELVHFSLWEHDTPRADGDLFEVLHLSAPGLDRLPRGRQW